MNELQDLKTAERLGMKIYYDGDCGFCKNTVEFMKKNFLIPETQILTAQSDINIENEMKKYNSWIVIDFKGNKYFKFKALTYVFNQSPKLNCLTCLMKISFVSFIGEKIYELVAENRKLISKITNKNNCKV